MAPKFALTLAAVAAAVSGVRATTLTLNNYVKFADGSAKYNPPTCAVPYDSLDLTRITAWSGITGDKDPKCGSCAQVCGAVGCDYLLVIDQCTLKADHLDISTAAGNKIVGSDTGNWDVTMKFVDVKNCANIWDGRMFQAWDEPNSNLKALQSLGSGSGSQGYGAGVFAPGASSAPASSAPAPSSSAPAPSSSAAPAAPSSAAPVVQSPAASSAPQASSAPAPTSAPAPSSTSSSAVSAISSVSSVSWILFSSVASSSSSSAAASVNQAVASSTSSSTPAVMTSFSSAILKPTGVFSSKSNSTASTSLAAQITTLASVFGTGASSGVAAATNSFGTISAPSASASAPKPFEGASAKTTSTTSGLAMGFLLVLMVVLA